MMSFAASFRVPGGSFSKLPERDKDEHLGFSGRQGSHYDPAEQDEERVNYKYNVLFNKKAALLNTADNSTFIVSRPLTARASSRSGLHSRATSLGLPSKADQGASRTPRVENKAGTSFFSGFTNTEGHHRRTFSQGLFSSPTSRPSTHRSVKFNC